jgi:hypothetical protein
MPLKVPQEPTDNWQTPAVEEIAAAANEILGNQSETEPKETEESATPEGKPEQKEQEQKTEEADRTGGEATPTGKPDDEVFQIDGKRYTMEEMREFQQGYLRQQDYTQKTQGLADDRREFEDKQRSEGSTVERVLEQNRQLMDLVKSGRQTPGEEGETGEATTAARPAIDEDRYREITERQDRIEQDGKDREAAARETERNGFIRDQFDATTQGLFDEFKIPEKQQELYKNALLGSGLDAEDPITGELSEASVGKVVRRAFLKLHDQAKTEVQKQTREALDTFKKEPKRKPVQVPPEKPEEKYQSPADQLRRGRRDPWDSQANTREYMERLQERTAPSD